MHNHSHDHSHDRMIDHDHEHEHMEHPGHFHERELPQLHRDFTQRSFTVGVGGPVGSGKTALVLALCRYLASDYDLAVVTNDIYTKEDAEALMRQAVRANVRVAANQLRHHRSRCRHTMGCRRWRSCRW